MLMLFNKDLDENYNNKSNNPGKQGTQDRKSRQDLTCASMLLWIITMTTGPRKNDSNGNNDETEGGSSQNPTTWADKVITLGPIE